jgi:asparagine synthase (glutamine-hydrolysing)
MSAFAGFVAFDRAPIDAQAEQRIASAAAGSRPGRVHIGRARDALFARLIPATDGAGETRPPAAGEPLFAADCRLDNRAELAAALGLAPGELAAMSDGGLILRAYRRWGEAGLARLLGAFTFALWDSETGRLVLGRDYIGARALFFHRGRGFVAFATTLNALFAMPGVPRGLDDVALANFLAVNFVETKRTFYRGIERVPSRTVVTIAAEQTTHRHYWSPDLNSPPPFRRDQDYVESARELLDQAVAAATADTPQVAISTSGGFDSSAVAATAARLGHAGRITCYTLVPPAGTEIALDKSRYLDERDKVTALVRMHPALELRLLAPDKGHAYEQDDTRYFARANMPVLGLANLGAWGFLYDAVAADRRRALLIGNFGNFGLTWDGPFSLLALLRAGRLPAFAHDLRRLARDSGRGLARTVAGDVVMPGAPRSLRRLIYRLRRRDPDSVAHFSALNPAFVAAQRLDEQWLEQGFDPWWGAAGWHPARHRARYLFDHNQFGRDARAMSVDMYGFEMRDPHADRRLLEFMLTIPEPVFRRDGVPRAFARAVLADRLPREILDERRKGAQTPNWFSNLNARRADIASELDRLEGSPLAKRLVDLPRLKRLLQEWPADANAAERRVQEYRLALTRGVHVGRFIRWVEGGNA